MADDIGTVLITGATGYLGHHVVRELKETLPKANLVALIRAPSDDLPDGVDAIQGELSDHHWAGADQVREIDIVLHLAAIVRHSRRGAGPMREANIEGTRRVAEVAKDRGARMVFLSSSGTVGCSRDDPDHSPDEEAPFCEDVVRQWPYYISKIEGERIVNRMRDDGLDAVILRPPIMHGPGDHRFRSTGNIVRVLRRKLPFLIQGGYSFNDVRDVAAACVAAATHPEPAPVYHLPGTSMGIVEFFQMVEEASGVPRPKRVLPYPIARLIAGVMMPFGVLPDPAVVEMARHHWGLSTRRAKTDLGWTPRSSGETIQDTVEWLQENHPDLQSHKS